MLQRFGSRVWLQSLMYMFGFNGFSWPDFIVQRECAGTLWTILNGLTTLLDPFILKWERNC